jgi:hypothetical protein
VLSDEVIDLADELFDTAEGAAANRFAGAPAGVSADELAAPARKSETRS